ncbi:alpha/beta-hydrolase [Patellaria atrata CBS 101060]|uniref:Alpha/beta-hydrolase n=1 Tax=Patellaria atrata CBS 101060 TaxID=1346257 RepID=A0A9P4VVW3_9PEZI|nr:alpha/beta-hydrolase [Patellaria atrata CBS 101060]
MDSAKTTRPPPVVIHPTSAHSHTFILLHGLGNIGDKFGREWLESGISSEGKRFTELFPGAKFWFDIYRLEDPSQPREVQLEGFAESANYIRNIIDQELDLLPPGKIILGGLSQGCAMSLMVLLSLEFPIGGYVGMSGWLPFRSDIDDIMGSGDTYDGSISFGDEDGNGGEGASTQVLRFVRDVLSLEEFGLGSVAAKTCVETPIFLGHGAKDEKVGCYLGEEAARTLRSLNINVTWKYYPELGHWYQIPDEIDDIVSFLHEVARI